MRLVFTSAVTELVLLATPAPKPSAYPWDNDEILEKYYKNFFIQSDCGSLSQWTNSQQNWNYVEVIQ